MGGFGVFGEGGYRDSLDDSSDAVRVGIAGNPAQVLSRSFDDPFGGQFLASAGVRATMGPVRVELGYRGRFGDQADSHMGGDHPDACRCSYGEPGLRSASVERPARFRVNRFPGCDDLPRHVAPKSPHGVLEAAARRIDCGVLPGASGAVASSSFDQSAARADDPMRRLLPTRPVPI